jgi:hypothetical protein
VAVAAFGIRRPPEEGGFLNTEMAAERKRIQEAEKNRQKERGWNRRLT